MLTKKSLLITGAAATIGFIGLAGASSAMAFHSPGDNNDGLIARIAQQFNLNQAEVEAVFDDYKSDQEEAKISAYLQKLVDKGKITVEQKTLIQTKLVEMRADLKAEHDALEAWAEQQGIDIEFVFRHDLQELVNEGQITPEQKTAIEAKREELKNKRTEMRSELHQWAKENNINIKYLLMGQGFFDRYPGHGYGHDHEHRRSHN